MNPGGVTPEPVSFTSGLHESCQEPYFCRGDIAPELVFIPATLCHPYMGLKDARCYAQKLSGKVCPGVENGECPIVEHSERGAPYGTSAQMLLLQDLQL